MEANHITTIAIYLVDSRVPRRHVLETFDLVADAVALALFEHPPVRHWFEFLDTFFLKDQSLKSMPSTSLTWGEKAATTPFQQARSLSHTYLIGT